MRQPPTPLPPLRTALALAFTLLALTTFACGGGPAEESRATDPATSDAAATDAGGDVEYEPAYPEEVSDQGLSEDDTRQQESPSHAEGEEHAHGDEGQMHDDDEDHMHDDHEDHMYDEHGDDGHQD